MDHGRDRPQGTRQADRISRSRRAHYRGSHFRAGNKFKDADGYPATAAPWGHLTAIDLKTGQFAWRIPFGEYPELLAAKGMKDTGSENYGGGLATWGSGLLLIGATLFDHKLHAYDSKTGKLLWDAELPYSGDSTPLTYMAGGKQYVVVGASGSRDPHGPKGRLLSPTVAW